LAAVAPALLALVACGSGSASPPAGAITVTATDDRCDVSTATTTAGSQTFSFKNTGRGLNELYIYSGTTVVGEKENIGPGLTGELTVDLPAGPIEVACKPGGVGDGIRSALTVSPAGAGSVPPSAGDAVLEHANMAYRRYVAGQADLFVMRTAAFVTAIHRGDLAGAKHLCAVARQPWERIEPVAASFGDRDRRIDARQGDVPAAQ